MTEQLVCLDDFEKAAKKILPGGALAYYENGADEEITLKRNREFGQSIIIKPRMLRDVSTRNTSVIIKATGYNAPFPIGVAPTASQCLANPDGELATSRAASSLGAVHICSTIATRSLEDIAAVANGGERWFQLYVCKDKKLTVSFVRRAESAGYKALVVTVDTPFAGKRRSELRTGFSLPPYLKMANFESHGDSANQMRAGKGKSGFAEFAKKLMDPSLNWDDIDWLLKATRLPVILKGILTGEDAETAVQHGVAGIIVSNHGARQLDTCPSTLEALIEISSRVKGRAELFLDGGVRTGTDVFKAVACGAKAVFLGRPILWGLAVAGEEGARRVLEIIAAEFDLAMALAGCRTVDEVKPQMLVSTDYYYTFLNGVKSVVSRL